MDLFTNWSLIKQVESLFRNYQQRRNLRVTSEEKQKDMAHGHGSVVHNAHSRKSSRHSIDSPISSDVR